MPTPTDDKVFDDMVIVDGAILTTSAYHMASKSSNKPAILGPAPPSSGSAGYFHGSVRRLFSVQFPVMLPVEEVAFSVLCDDLTGLPLDVLSGRAAS